MGMVVAGIIALTAGAGIVVYLWRSAPPEVTPEKDVLSQRLSMALEQVVDGDFQEAFKTVSEAVSETDAPASVYFALAAFLRARGQVDRSAHVLRTILVRSDLLPSLKANATVSLAADLTQLGKLDEANQLIESLPKKLRKDAEARALKQEAARQRGQWQEALGMGRTRAKRGEIDPTNELAEIAEEAAQEGDWDAAVKGFHDVLKADERSVRAHCGLGRILNQQGKSGRARKHFVSAIQANPALAPSLLPLIRDTFGSGADKRFAELLDDLSEPAELQLWLDLERVDELYRREEVDQCRELLERVLADHPKSLEAHEAYINLLMELELNKELHEHISRFVDVAAEEMRRFSCQDCGFLGSKPFLRCPRCSLVGTALYQA